jgi:hypothetical protein
MVLVRAPGAFLQEPTMIKCQGTLRIKKIRQSRNGAFCIADLATDFGEFKVKDPLLDQFEEGEYQGTVWISEIYMSQYISYGKAVTELRARLHDLQVDSEDRKPVRSNEHSEPDPVDELPTPQVPHKTTPKSAKRTDWASMKGNRLGKETTPTPETSAGQPATNSGANSTGDDVVLFGQELAMLIAEHQAVKLDPTVDRVLFRKQTAGLKARGYTFDSKQQTWIRPGE